MFVKDVRKNSGKTENGWPREVRLDATSDELEELGVKPTEDEELKGAIYVHDEVRAKLDGSLAKARRRNSELERRVADLEMKVETANAHLRRTRGALNRLRGQTLQVLDQYRSPADRLREDLQLDAFNSDDEC